MLAALPGCDGLHRSVYNMTPCPIVVRYAYPSMASTRMAILPSGGNTEMFGGPPLRLVYLAVTDDSGALREYSAEELDRLRPSLRLEDRWGFFPDGLRFLHDEKSPVPVSIEGLQACRSADVPARSVGQH
jgi:hypothetical protein